MSRPLLDPRRSRLQIQWESRLLHFMCYELFWSMNHGCTYMGTDGQAHRRIANATDESRVDGYERCMQGHVQTLHMRPPYLRHVSQPFQE